MAMKDPSWQGGQLTDAAAPSSARGREPVDRGTLTGSVPLLVLPKVDELEVMKVSLARAYKRIRELERQVDEDTLLPLPNRRAFVRELARSIAYAERYGMGGVILYYDVNELKPINDRFGHAAGDAALARVAGVLSDNLRGSDFVARLGGDEFGVIMPQIGVPQALEKAEQLAAKIAAAPLLWHGYPIQLSVAYGVHGFQPRQDPDAAIAAADHAMYRQKRQNAS